MPNAVKKLKQEEKKVNETIEGEIVDKKDDI